jgi:hypothetical protein
MKKHKNPSYPIKDAKARTTSNLPAAAVRALRAFDRTERHEQMALHEQVARKYGRQISKLLSRKDRDLMCRISDQVAGEFREASLAAGGDSSRIAKLRAAARRKRDRLLRREIPKFVQARALRRAEMREHQKLSARVLKRSGKERGEFTWGVLPGGPNCVEFVPPFTVVELSKPDTDFVRNDSFAKPAIGHLVNDIDFDDNAGTPPPFDTLGILLRTLAIDSVACGVAFTTPRAGRLRVSAVMRNLYNKVMVSLTDKCCLSSAHFRTFVRLAIVILRGSNATVLPKTIRSTGFVSQGDDASFTETPLDESVSFTIRKTTLNRVNANESVFVLAAAQVGVDSTLDDMRLKVNALLWWELQSLCIEVVD